MQIFLLLAVAVAAAFALPFEITYYSNSNFTGEQLTVRETKLNIQSSIESLLGKNIYPCATDGFWVTTNACNGYPTCWLHLGSGSEGYRSCWSSGASNITNIYRVGPSDTAILSITFRIYNDQITTIEKIADANVNIINYTGGNVYFTGWSNWTIFEGTNFEGPSICHRSKREAEWYQTNDGSFSPSVIKHFGSVIRGCDFSRSYIDELRFNEKY